MATLKMLLCIKGKGKQESKTSLNVEHLHVNRSFIWLEEKNVKNKHVSYFSLNCRRVKADCLQTLEGTPWAIYTVEQQCKEHVTYSC